MIFKRLFILFEAQNNSMKIKLSAVYEGKCDICGKVKKNVFSAGDEETGRVVTICRECSDERPGMMTSEAIERYVHEEKTAFEGGIKVEKGKTSAA
ncbi:MAG TPA: hypothetical protein VJJ76_01220 [archaeon]|nr:hypothetical protein [archaeon]